MSVYDIGDLKREARLVECPACAAIKHTIRVRQSFDSDSNSAVIWWSVFSLGTAFLGRLTSGPHGQWLAHYCAHCGLRLMLYAARGRRYPFDEAQVGSLLGQKRYTGGFVASPYPADSSLVATTNFKRWGDRYRVLSPTAVYWIDSNPPTSMPITFWDEDRVEKMYTVTYPDFDRGEKFGGEFFFDGKRDVTKVVETVLAPDNASMRVESVRHDEKHGSVVGMVQLAQMSWDVTFFFPKDQTVSSGFDTQKCRIAGEQHFEIRLPHFLWQSHQGHLLWTRRLVTDAREVLYPKRKVRLVLLDSYDRIVAMEYQPVPDFSEITAVARAPLGIVHTRKQLRLYGFASKVLANEIITSYVALYGQLCRRHEWDSIYLDDD